MVEAYEMRFLRHLFLGMTLILRRARRSPLIISAAVEQAVRLFWWVACQYYPLRLTVAKV